MNWGGGSKAQTELNDTHKELTNKSQFNILAV